MWFALLLLSVLALVGGLVLLFRAFQRRRSKRPGLLALAAAPVLFVASLFNLPSGTAQPQAQAPTPAPVTTPTPPPAPEPEPVSTLAADLLQMGSDPASLEAVETSSEGDRRYFTWDRPDIGQQVNTVWIAPDDWWIKVSPAAFDPGELGRTEYRDGLRQIVDGPLTGTILNEGDQGEVLHLWSPKWHARTFQ